MTKLSEKFKYKRFLEQAEVTNASGCYRDHANPVSSEIYDPCEIPDHA